MAGRLTVVGAGLMGSGIAQVSAAAGWDVTLRDVSDEALLRGRSAIEKSLARFVDKGTLQEGQRDAALARITTTTDVEAAASADIVVEAVFESLEAKHDVFGQLDRICADDAIDVGWFGPDDLGDSQLAATMWPLLEKLFGRSYADRHPRS